MGLQTAGTRSNNFLVIKYKAICRELQETPVTDQEKADAIAAGYQEITVQNPSKPLPDGSGYETVQKWVQKFFSLSGRIVDAEWYDRTHNDVRYLGIKLKIRDRETNELFFLDLPFNDKAYNVFTRVMENIDFDQDVEVCAWPDKSKPNATAVLFKQGEQSVKWRYTREHHQQILDELIRAGNNDLAVEFEQAINPKRKLPNGEIVIDRETAFISPDLQEKMALAGYTVAPLPKFVPQKQWDFSQMQAFLYRRFIDIIQPRIKELNKFDDPQADMPDEQPPAQVSPAEVSPTGDTSAQAPPSGLSPIQEAQQSVAIAAGKTAPYSTLPTAGGTDDDIPF